MNASFFMQFLPIIAAAVAAQESAFAVSEGTKLLAAENARISAGWSPQRISGFVNDAVEFALKEQAALINQITHLGQPAATAAVTKLQTAARGCVHP